MARVEAIILSVDFVYDVTRGVFEGRVGGTRFLFGGGQDAPMPKTLQNALSALRRDTQQVNVKSLRQVLEYESKPEVREELLRKIQEFEARGGRTQIVGRSIPKPALTTLTLEDLEIEI